MANNRKMAIGGSCGWIKSLVKQKHETIQTAVMTAMMEKGGLVEEIEYHERNLGKHIP